MTVLDLSDLIKMMEEEVRRVRRRLPPCRLLPHRPAAAAAVEERDRNSPWCWLPPVRRKLKSSGGSRNSMTGPRA